MDDVIRLAEDVESAQYGNDRMEDMVNRKVLEFNLEKSNYVIIGNKKARKTLRDKLEKNPLTLCGREMKESQSIKFLGDFLNFNLKESVHETVKKC